MHRRLLSYANKRNQSVTTNKQNKNQKNQENILNLLSLSITHTLYPPSIKTKPIQTMNQSISIYKKWSPNEALKRAAKRGKMDLLQTALRAGADINHVSETDPNTALSLACSHGKTAIIEHLLKQGATISVEYVPPLPLLPPPPKLKLSLLLLWNGADWSA